MEKDEPNNLGHRARLRSKLLHSGGDALLDYELLELVLSFAIPRCDVKPIAKRLISRFGNLSSVFSASPEELMSVNGIKENSAAAIKVVKECAIRSLKIEITEKPIINNWDKLIDYCRCSIGNNKEETAKILFLNAKNRLLSDEMENKGTVDFTPLFPREIVKKALELQASSVILIHNHPSGDFKPSKEDISMTKQVSQALSSVGITLHDHLIVSQKGYYSFRNNMLLK